ncbi:MAG: hypothetical protein ACTJIB_10485 [Pseudoalteromonas prydzensis]|uniref:hypothetical protein n=1 Tax=Pseudoalteromonas prydzensis TaxID=182141 RepID=UPI003F955C4A
MSVTVTFTDLEAAVLRNIFMSLLDPADVDFKVHCDISSKVSTKCDLRSEQLEKALEKHNESIVLE